MPFIELQTIDSTNNYALGQIHASGLPGGQGFTPHGLVVFSHEQTAGKGQRGRKWASAPGTNIAMSIVLNPTPLQVSQQFQLSVCAAESVRRFFAELAGDETKIKWPNDIYWRDRKAAGILVESVVGSRESQAPEWQWAVVGIGININQVSFPPDLPNPVSLKQVTGKTYDPVRLAKELCTLFDEEFKKLTHDGFGSQFATYLSHLYKRNEKVKLKKDNRVFDAVIKSVSPAGRLIVEHALEEEFEFGEIEWVINQ